MKKPNRIAGNGDSKRPRAQSKANTGNPGKKPATRNARLQRAGESWLASLIGGSGVFQEALLAVRSGLAVEVDGYGFTKRETIALFTAAAKVGPSEIKIHNCPLSTAEFSALQRKLGTTGTVYLRGRKPDASPTREDLTGGAN